MYIIVSMVIFKANDSRVSWKLVPTDYTTDYTNTPPVEERFNYGNMI